jgi:hypothetical protein
MDSHPRYSRFHLLRRLDLDGKNQGPSTSTRTTSYQQIKTIGMDHQLQEVGLTTYIETGTPRLLLEYPNYDSLSTNQKTSGLTPLYQTDLGSLKTTNTTDDTQRNNANSSSNIRNFSSPTIHQALIVLQKSDGEDREGLGSSGYHQSRKSSRTTLVVPQPSEMDWPLIPADDSNANRLCRRQQHRLGLALERSDHSWVLNTTGSRTVNQLERTQGSSSGTSNISSCQEYNSSDPKRQHNQLVLYKQTRRGSFSSLDEPRNRSMGLVHQKQYPDSSTTHCWL